MIREFYILSEIMNVAKEIDAVKGEFIMCGIELRIVMCNIKWFLNFKRI